MPQGSVALLLLLFYGPNTPSKYCQWWITHICLYRIIPSVLVQTYQIDITCFGLHARVFHLHRIVLDHKFHTNILHLWLKMRSTTQNGLPYEGEKLYSLYSSLDSWPHSTIANMLQIIIWQKSKTHHRSSPYKLGQLVLIGRPSVAVSGQSFWLKNIYNHR